MVLAHERIGRSKGRSEDMQRKTTMGRLRAEVIPLMVRLALMSQNSEFSGVRMLISHVYICKLLSKMIEEGKRRI